MWHELKSLSQRGPLHEDLLVSLHIWTSGVHVPSKAFHIILQDCISKTNLDYGRAVLRFIVENGLGSDAFLGSQLIRMFAACESLSEANQVFYSILKPNKFSWSAIILANATLGQGQNALDLYHRMQQSGLELDGHIFVAALKACGVTTSLVEGRSIENRVKHTLEIDTFVGNALIDMYMKCASFEDAHRVFDSLPKRDVISWNTLIGGYAQKGLFKEGWNFFQKMLLTRTKPDAVTYVNILKSCDKARLLTEVRIIHACILESGFEPEVHVGNTLIHVYASCSSLEDARSSFDNVSKPGLVTWNAMIDGYVDNGENLQAFVLFHGMHEKGMQPNRVTFLGVLKACSNIACGCLGKQIHTYIVESHAETDSAVGNSLIDMYAKCGSLEEASWVFNKLPKEVIVTWNALMSGFGHHGENGKAFDLFSEMLETSVQPDPATFVSVIKACSPGLPITDKGLEIHTLVTISASEGDVMVGNCLLDMYIRYGSLDNARRVFDRMSNRDIVSWNTMMAGYVHYSLNHEVALLFHQLQRGGGEPDRATFLSVLKACSTTPVPEQCNILYHLVLKSEFASDEAIQSTLVHMYIRCGNLQEANSVFNRLSARDLVMWNTLIAGYAQRGKRELVQQLFRSMQIEGLQPDEVTFLTLLASLSYKGLVEEVRGFFQVMQEDYGIVPTLNHFNCIADLLGRAGCLAEAKDVLQSMPPVPNLVGWTSLLDHSKTYSNFHVGRHSYDSFVTLDEGDATGYVLMVDIFTRVCMQQEADNSEDLKP